MYTGCNLKTMELLDCVLIWACVVIRSNTVYLHKKKKKKRKRKNVYLDTPLIWSSGTHFDCLI